MKNDITIMSALKIPDRPKIESIAETLVLSLGGGVHLHSSALAFSVDNVYPDLSDIEFESVKRLCVEVADKVRSDALRAMWGDRS